MFVIVAPCFLLPEGKTVFTIYDTCFQEITSPSVGEIRHSGAECARKLYLLYHDKHLNVIANMARYYRNLLGSLDKIDVHHDWLHRTPTLHPYLVLARTRIQNYCS